jgi:hypothetical protein
LYQLAAPGEYVEIATLRFLSFRADASPKYCIESVLSTIRSPALELLTITVLDQWNGLRPRALESTHAIPLPLFPVLRSMELKGIKCADL